MEPILSAVRSVRLRLQAVRVCAFALRGLAAGFAAAALLLAAARFVPVAHAPLWALALLPAGALLGAAAAYRRPVGTAEAARAMDRADPAEERRDLMKTALEFAGQDSAAANWQRAQARAYALEFAAERGKRLPFPRKFGRPGVVSAALLALCLLLLLLPNPMDTQLRQREQEQALIEEQRGKAEALAKELAQAPIEPQARAPLAEAAANLAERLGDSGRAEEALEQMARTMKALGSQAEAAAGEQRELEDWSRKLAAQQALQEAAKPQAGDASERAEALKDAMNQLSAQQKEALAEAMQSLAEQAPQAGKETGALQEALKKAAEQLAASGNLSDEQLRELAEKLAAAASESGGLGEQSDLAAAAAAQLARSGMQMAGELAASGLSLSEAWGSGGAAEALADAGEAGSPGSGESGEGEGSPGESGEGGDGTGAAGSGQGSGSPGGASGQGAGQGSGQGSGQGAGSGSGAGSGAGSGGSGSGQGGSGAGQGSGGRELVTTPRNLQGEGNVQSDGGPSSGGDKQTGGVSPTIDGVSRPYEEVYGQYSERAKESLGRSQLPQSVQGLVESYFTEIRPQS